MMIYDIPTPKLDWWSRRIFLIIQSKLSVIGQQYNRGEKPLLSRSKRSLYDGELNVIDYFFIDQNNYLLEYFVMEAECVSV